MGRLLGSTTRRDNPIVAQVRGDQSEEPLLNLFIPMFITGLLTSFHCVMMCGNMVLSYAIKDAGEGPLLKRMMPHLGYHGAKILSYTVVGILLGSVGSFISAGARSWVSVAAGAYMVLLGLSLTGKFPLLRHLAPRPPRFFMTLLSKMRRRANREQAEDGSGLATPVGFGLITGFMPCGPLIAAQMAAAGSGSAATGGLMMLGFGLGTAPLMLAYGGVASYLSSRLKRYMAVAAAITIMVLGLVMVNRGATALGSPVNFDAAKRVAMGAEAVRVDASQFKKGPDGVIEVPLGLQGFTFTPSTLVIPPDTPIRIVVDRKDDNVCSDELWIPALGVRAPLVARGITRIDLPAVEAGTYQMTCQMGMLSATLQVGGSDGSSSPVLLVLGLTAAAGGIGAGVHLERRRREAKVAAEAAKRKAHNKRPRAKGHTTKKRNRTHR